MATYTDPCDAYGHMTYCVGWGDDGDDRGDWIACADYAISDCGKFVAYHVVINSDSGAFIDTVDEGEFPISKALENLLGVLEYWYDIGSEHLVADDKWFTDEEITENQAAIARWKHDLRRDLEVTA